MRGGGDGGGGAGSRRYRGSTPRSAPSQQRGMSSVAPPLAPLPPRAAPARLHVFDFDQTLVDTMLPDAGAAAWFAATGRPYTYAGWWGRPESLSPLLPTRPGPALGAYHAAAADDGGVVALLTGRRAHLAPEVRACLAAHGIKALHAELFNDTNHETVTFKEHALRALCRRVLCACASARTLAACARFAVLSAARTDSGGAWAGSTVKRCRKCTSTRIGRRTRCAAAQRTCARACGCVRASHSCARRRGFATHAGAV
jgi:hypothetical protein